MAHAYTPGLRVSERCVITKRRMLPIRGNVLVKLGERVTPEQIVARTDLPGNVQLVNIAHHLGIEAADVPAKIKVEAGVAVKKGQLIAENVGFFGLFRTEVKAPCDGSIESVSKVTGQALLREPPVPLEVTAYIGGEVTEVVEAEGVQITTQGSIIQGIIGIGSEKHGKIMMVASAPDHVLRPEDLNASCKGKIVIGGRRANLDVYRRATELGAVGLVLGSFDDTDLGSILGYDLGIAITGGEDLVTTLILTEGFGELSMARRTYEMLTRLNGRKASINGATQIRAGVIRPEIIVSLDDISSDEIVASTTETKAGARVRIIRQPHFGVIGRIKSLPTESVVIESGATVRVMVVELPDGSEHTLPRANVELIEE